VQANRPQALRWPFGTQPALALWQALYFRPARFQPEPGRSAEWNRGAYLVQGLGHCAACHAGRNALGGPASGREGGDGGLVPQQGWYAPSLRSPLEAGVADWPLDEVVRLLRTGVSARGSVLGPMAEVVHRSTQHLDPADLRAMAVYLQALPQDRAPRPPAAPAPATVKVEGERLYRQQCASCHGEQGQGVPGAYPPLVGNRTVTMEPPINAIRAVLSGGFPPSTAGNPRPHGMPPMTLDDAQVAAVLSFVRQGWGQRASAISPRQVQQARESNR
jgi:mono/diheme cytochrome c family protein